MSTFYDRILEEKEQLNDKIEKLDSFLKSNKINNLETRQASLLKIQFNLMCAYSLVLDERLSLLQEPATTG